METRVTNNDAVSFLIIDGTEPSDYMIQYNCTAINQFGEDSVIISLREEGERTFICHTIGCQNNIIFLHIYLVIDVSGSL